MKSRYVSVDMGYGPAEHWVRAKVIESQRCSNLFDNGTSESLLVEVPGGTRLWVAYWTETE